MKFKMNLLRCYPKYIYLSKHITLEMETFMDFLECFFCFLFAVFNLSVCSLTPPTLGISTPRTELKINILNVLAFYLPNVIS